MMKSKHVLLLASVCMTLNLIASNQDNATHERNISSEKIKTFSVPVAAPQTSGLLTTLWYGFGKKVGLTSAQTYFELADNGTLEADVKNNTAEAIRRLEEATEERFKRKDLTSPTNQEKISKIFNITEQIKSSTGINFGIHQALAAEYNPLQAEALIAIMSRHANTVQPNLQREKENAIAIANQIYDREITDLLTFAAQTAANKRYVNAQAEANAEFDLQEKKHYTSPTSYEVLLKSIRENK